jgi:phosphate-selective porin OprO and OprP
MNFNKKLAVAVSSAVLLMAGQVALADSATDIVDALVSKGVLTEEEGKLITKGHKSKTDITPVVKTKDNALSLETADGNSSLQVNGRIHFDYRNYDYDDAIASTATTTGADTFDLRRARVGVKGKFGKYYSGEIVMNLLDQSKMSLDVGYLDVLWFEKAKFRFGQFKMPFSLEQLTSSNNVDFIERSFVDQQIPAKERGVQVFGSPRTGTTYAVALSTGNAAADQEAATAREGDNAQDGVDVIGRGTVNLAEIAGDPKNNIYHLGLAFSTGSRLASQADVNVGGDGVARTRGVTFLNLAVPTFGHTNFDPASKVNRLGLEAIAASGPFKLQGQYVRAGYSFASSATAYHDPDITTGYLQATYTLTGETHAGRYKDGVLSGLKPTKAFDPDTFSGGAWELAFRMGHYDASEHRGIGTVTPTSASALKAKDYTLGLMFVPNPNVRFMGNLTHTSFSDLIGTGPSVGGRPISSETALLFRTQLAF